MYVRSAAAGMNGGQWHGSNLGFSHLGARFVMRNLAAVIGPARRQLNHPSIYVRRFFFLRTFLPFILVYIHQFISVNFSRDAFTKNEEGNSPERKEKGSSNLFSDEHELSAEAKTSSGIVRTIPIKRDGLNQCFL